MWGGCYGFVFVGNCGREGCALSLWAAYDLYLGVHAG